MSLRAARSSEIGVLGRPGAWERNMKNLVSVACVMNDDGMANWPPLRVVG